MRLYGYLLSHYPSVSAEVQASQRPWKLTACVVLNPSLLNHLEVRGTVSSAPSKRCILSSEEVSTGKLMRSREDALIASKETLRSVVVRAAGVSLTSFMWIRWQLGS